MLEGAPITQAEIITELTVAIETLASGRTELARRQLVVLRAEIQDGTEPPTATAAKESAA